VQAPTVAREVQRQRLKEQIFDFDHDSASLFHGV